MPTVDPKHTLGSRRVKQFRSPAEFAPHAAWLLTDPSLDPSNCECKYCRKDAGRPHKSRIQRDRSDTPATITSLSSLGVHCSTPSAARSASFNGSEHPPRNIRRQPSLRKISPQQEDSGEEAPIPSQLSDLVALSRGRLYRDQELVWLVLAEPLRTSLLSENDYTLRFWPGVVRNVVSSRQTEGPGNCYLVTIMSAGRSYIVPQQSIIPFRAYSLDENALANLRSLSAGIPSDGFHHGFDPLPQSATLEACSSSDSVFRHSPFELFITDIKMAKHIATTWTTTDRRSLVGQRSKESTPLRQSVEEVNRRGYRGLWWGAERIWAGDFLILSFPESSIKYSSKDSSCFVYDLRNEDSIGNLPPEDRKPEEKCVFFKLRALETVRTEQGVAVLEAIGSIYRLAPSLPGSRSSNAGLPRPPDGFVFRAVLSAGVETQLPLRFIRGRYYPQILSSVNKDVLVERKLKAMEGLCPPGPSSWRPSKYVTESRHDTLNRNMW